MAEVNVSETISADPVAVYDLVGDVTRMGEWSPETTGGRWLDGATAPVPGSRFTGQNRRGWRRWSTTCTVEDADVGRRFAFRVQFGPIPISRWAYDLEPADGGCRVTETWTDRRPRWFANPLTLRAMGIRDQAEHNRGLMRTTLAALKQAAEGAPAR